MPLAVIFGLLLLFVFLILAAQYKSWALPISVLICTPVAVVRSVSDAVWQAAGK
jgi:hydrophobic/amphiphilic exporter-1 (mainly G- bacteria), HAE1 family